MNDASVGPVGRSSMTSTLEAASQQQVLTICSRPVQSIRAQTASGLHLSLESALFLVNI